MGQNDRMLSYLPLAHVVERVLVEHGWLRTGMHVFFAESAGNLHRRHAARRPTIFFSVPRLWVKFQQGILSKMPQAKLDKLLRIPILSQHRAQEEVLKTALGLDQCRIAAGGAAPMPPQLLAWYRKLGLPVCEGYGMTENLAVSHITVPGKDQTGTVGPPYDGVQAASTKKTGEIQMKSPAVMKGYYKEPELTAEAFTSRRLAAHRRQGRTRRRGNLKITGRVKDLFKTSKGKYVAPAPIEDKIVMHGAVEACAVTGANMGQPIGLGMLSPGGIERAASDPEGLKAELAEHLKSINETLDPHEQMDCIVLFKQPWTVDNGLITPTFKVKRNRQRVARRTARLGHTPRAPHGALFTGSRCAAPRRRCAWEAAGSARRPPAWPARRPRRCPARA
jgi:long-chain acyl-CoA synthetase